MHKRSTPSPKAKTSNFFGVVANRPQNIRIDHARAAEFDPIAFPREVRFDAWFREREKAWSKTNRDIRPQIVGGEHPQDTLQLSHRHGLVDPQPFHLMEHRKVRLIRGIRSIDSAQRDDAHRRRMLLHDANLYRTGLAPQQARVGGRRIELFACTGQEEVVQWIASRVVFGDVQRDKVVPRIFNLGTFHHGEPEAPP